MSERISVELSPEFKRIVWHWLVQQEGHVIVAIDGEPLEYEEAIQGVEHIAEKYGGEDKIRVYASEEDQWVKLTGRPKEGNPIGPFPFKLLCAVSRSRSRGITSVEIAKETGQDPRSIHGRVSLLIDYGLVQRFPIVHGGMSTHLTVYRKFVEHNRQATSQNRDSGVGIDMNELKRAIVTAVKQAKNGLRQHDDLKRELGFDRTHRTQIIFASRVRQLESLGYVRRVVVKRSGHPEDRFRCIKFVKDLPEVEQVDDSADESDDNLFDEINEGGAGTGAAGSGGASGGPNGGARSSTPLEGEGNSVINPSELESDAIKVEEDAEAANEVAANSQGVTFNLFYPLEHQVYTVIHNSGIQGVPAMKLCDHIVGSTYSRIFSRFLDTVVDKLPGKGSAPKKKGKATGQPPHLEHLNIIRGIDFSARMKFYRYFTQVAYCQYVNKEPNPRWGEFKQPDLRGSAGSVQELENRNKKPLPGLMEVYSENGHLVPLFHGEKGKISGGSVVVAAPKTPVTSTGKKRGRPRKRPLSDDESTPVQSQGKKRGRKPKVSQVEQVDQVGQIEQIDQAAQPEQAGQTDQSNQLSSVGQEAEVANVGNVTDVTAITDTPMALLPDSTISGTPTQVANSVTSDQPPQTNETPVIQSVQQTPETVDESVLESTQQETRENGDRSTPTPIFRSTPSNGEKTAWYRELKKKRAYEGEISFAAMKRQNNIMEIVKMDNGMTEGGNSMVKRLAKEFPNTSAVDRKTMEREVDALERQNKLAVLSFTVSNGREKFKKFLLVDPTVVDPESEKVAQEKQRLIETGKNRNAVASTPATEIAVEENDFQYYMGLPKKLLPRTQSASSKENKTMSRLAKTDKERRAKERPLRPKVSQARQQPSVETQAVPGTDEYAELARLAGMSAGITPSTPTSAIKRRRRRTTADTSDPLASLSEGLIKRRTPSSVDRKPKAKPEKREQKAKVVRRKLEKLDSDTFYRVVIIVRSLYYNSLGTISWDAVVQCLPMLTVDMAKAKWPRIRDMYGGTAGMHKATQRWESLFLKSYEQGVLPIIEDDDYDILYYASFWRSCDKEVDESTSPWLYKTRAETEEKYEVSVDDVIEPLEGVYSSPSMVRTGEIMTNCSLSYPTKRANVHDNRDVVKAKQAIKAIIATDNSLYDTGKAKQILDDLGEQVCTSAIMELEREKSIIYLAKSREKFAPGRNFWFSDRFLNPLQLKYPETILDEATKFEKTLLGAVSSKKGLIMSRAAPDSSLVCILDFIAYRLADFVRVNMSIGSLLRDGYKSRLIEKDKLDCDIVLRNRENVDIEAMARPQVPEPLAQPGGNIWTGVTGDLNKDIWTKLVRFMLLSITMRPGATAEVLFSKVRPILTVEEVDQLLNWLCQRQCIRSGPCDGYWVEPRWYSNVLT